MFTGTYNGSATTFPFTIYAKILSGPAATAPGTYTDTYVASSQAVIDSDSVPDFNPADECAGNSGTHFYNTFPFTVSVTVLASCSVTATALNFGSVASPITAAVTSTATVTAQCTNTTPYSIGLDNGLHANGTQRRMQESGTSNYVSYNLYTDPGDSLAWTTTSGTASCSGGTGTCALGTGNGSNQGITVYGQVPVQSTPPVGAYSDTVVVTLTY